MDLVPAAVRRVLSSAVRPQRRAGQPRQLQRLLGEPDPCVGVHLAPDRVDDVVPGPEPTAALAVGLARHLDPQIRVDPLLARTGRRRLAQVAVPVRDRAGLVIMSAAVDIAADGSTVAGPAEDRLVDLLTVRAP